MLNIRLIAEKVFDEVRCPLAMHKYKFDKQVWVRVASNKFQLQNREKCEICGTTRHKRIGEK